MPHRPPPSHPFGALHALLGHPALRGAQRFSPDEAWTPATNVYQLRDRLVVCVDLAGVEREAVDVEVEVGRLMIRGLRMSPEPVQLEAEAHESHESHEEFPPRCEAMRILSMEIDSGPFRRDLALPETVDLSRVESRLREGLLWIILPLRR